MATLIERRPALFPFVVAVVASRVVLSVLAATEERNDILSLLITVILVVEVVVVWRAVQTVRSRGAAPDQGGRQGGGPDRIDTLLRVVERVGAPLVYVTTGACAVAFALLRAHHSSPGEILDVIAVVRWVQLVLLLVVLYLARRWELGRSQRRGWSPPVA
jgi:hypothetical protein